VLNREAPGGNPGTPGMKATPPSMPLQYSTQDCVAGSDALESERRLAKQNGARMVRTLMVVAG